MDNDGAKKSSGYQTPGDFVYKKKKSKNVVTTFHGSSYLQKSTFWKFVIACSAILATVSIILIFFGAHQHDKSPRKISSIPFPALTICPETKSQKSMVDFGKNYRSLMTENASTLDNDEVKNMEALSQVCDSHLLTRQLSLKPTNGKDFSEILRNFSIPNFILFCKFRENLVDCSEYFTETLTSEGVCQTFNAVDEKLWNLVDGYENDEFDVKPFRAVSGIKYGLSIVLGVNSTDLDYLCKGPSQGYRYKLHLPNESPNFDESYEKIPLATDVTVKIKPKMKIDLGSSCSQSQSHKKCLAKCEESHLLSKCGCLRFNIPHNEEIEACNQHQIDCVVKASREFHVNNSRFGCDCRPDCMRLKYSSTERFEKYNFLSVFKSFDENIDDEFPTIIMSRLWIYFDEKFFVPSITVDRFDVISIISKIGGVFAFFLGASCLTFLELLYLFTRKLFN